MCKSGVRNVSFTEKFCIGTKADELFECVDYIVGLTLNPNLGGAGGAGGGVII